MTTLVNEIENGLETSTTLRDCHDREVNPTLGYAAPAHSSVRGIHTTTHDHHAQEIRFTKTSNNCKAQTLLYILLQRGT
jgi:hypothetical protein